MTTTANDHVEASMMQTLTQDLSYALRGIVRRPAFSVVVIATLALGIGANTAIFSVVSGILIRPLPYPHPERVVAFTHEAPTWLVSDADFLLYRKQLASFEGLAAFTRHEVTLTGRGEPQRIRMARGTEDFFPVLGVRPLLGRVFVAGEHQGNPPTSIVLSHGLWQRLGADSGIVGRSITISGIPRTVVGVMPPHFNYPSATTDVWSPMPRFRPDSLYGRGNNYLFMVGRLKPGVSVERIRREAGGVAKIIMRDFSQSYNPKEPLTPKIAAVRDELVGKTRPYLIALLGAVGFVLLIACVNVANLLLVRGESRRKELAVRTALGASGRRLMGQLLLESSVLAIVGGVLGIALAWGMNRVLIAVAPASIPRLAEIAIDWRVLAFSLAASVFAGLLIGVMPAVRASMSRSLDALRDGGRFSSAPGSRGGRHALVVAEVALAVMTLTGAGMLLRSLWHLQSNDIGYEPRNVLTAKVSISGSQYNDARATVFFDQLLERVRAIPGVQAAGAGFWLPVVDAGGLWGYRVPERVSEYKPGQWPTAVPQQATAGYFKAMGQRIIAGREFTGNDREGAPYVSVVSKTFAEKNWPGEDAVGKVYQLREDTPLMTVVGVVSDIRSRGFDDTPEPTMYFPYPQAAKSAYFMPRAMALHVRTSVDPMTVAAAVRKAVHSLDPGAPVSEVRTLDHVVGTSVANRKFSTSLLVGFASLALLLAGIGAYGVVAYGVTQRQFEIGVRMALGAERGAVHSLIMREGLRMAAAGLLIGILGSIAIARFMRSLLVGVSLLDVPTLVAVAALLMIVTVVASFLPARRASGVNPVEALRGG